MERILKIKEGVKVIKWLLVLFLVLCYCCQFVQSNGKEGNLRILKGKKAHVGTQVAGARCAPLFVVAAGCDSTQGSLHSHHPSHLLQHSMSFTFL